MLLKQNNNRKKNQAESPFTKKLFDTCKEWTFKTNGIELLFYLKPQ